MKRDTIIYKTFIKRTFNAKLFKPIKNTSINKPAGGLWGCVDDAWYYWCKDNDFPCGADYVSWVPLDAEIYVVDTVQDFVNLCENYPLPLGPTNLKSIDFVKLSKEYDGIEVTKNAMTLLRFIDETDEVPEHIRRSFLTGLSSWDVPSLCMFDLNKVAFLARIRQ